MNKKINIIVILFVLFNFYNSFSQVAINTTNIDATAELKINSADKGLLIPRVSLTSSTDVTTILNPATSLMVFNTSSISDLGTGYYFWNGLKWEKIHDAIKTNAQAKYVNNTASSSLELNTSMLAPIFATEVRNDLASLYSKTSNTQLTVAEGGRYEISVNLYLYSDQNSSQPICQLKVNGNPKGAISATGYVNTDDSNFRKSFHIYETFNLNVGDVITVQMSSLYNGQTRFESIGTSSFLITKIR